MFPGKSSSGKEEVFRILRGGDELDWWIGLLGSAVIAGAALARNSLSPSGAAAAVFVGTPLYALGSAGWFLPLIAFFVSSTMLTHWKRQKKSRLETDYEKSGRRDAGQVLANGGLGTLLCLAHAAVPNPLWQVSFLGAIAAVNADTWATEVGSLSRGQPRSILGGKPVAAGTSGGVTGTGLAAAFCGALFIGAVGLLGEAGAGGRDILLPALPAVAVGGFIGALADSLLGATIQEMRRCPVCGRQVEAKIHCGRTALHVRGIRGINNDAVNFLCSLAGAAAALLLTILV